MGLFSVGCQLENQQDRTRSVRVPKVMVDTGSELTWISHRHLEEIGVEPEKKNRRFIMANGQEITRSIQWGRITGTSPRCSTIGRKSRSENSNGIPSSIQNEPMTTSTVLRTVTPALRSAR